MWKILKLFGHLLKGLFWLAFFLLVLGLVMLYLLERGLPLPLLRRLETAISTDDHFIRIERATFSLKRGVRLFHVKALPKRTAGNALVSIDEIALDIAFSPGLAPAERLRGVTIKNIEMPALPPKKTDKDDSPPPVIPDVPPFPLVVEEADILGIQAHRLTAMVSAAEGRAHITDIIIHLPHPTSRLRVNAEVTIDPAAHRINGTASGNAYPEALLPLFTLLKAKGAVHQITRFSEIARPINADYTFDVDTDTTDFAMRLDVDVGPCLYRGEPIAHAKGTLGIYGTNIYTTVVIDPLEAKTGAGAPISGSLAYREETEGLEVDVATTMDIKPLFNMINILNHGELDCIHCLLPPTLAARGQIALSSIKSKLPNNLTGKVSFPAGAILNFKAKEVTADLALDGYSARLHNIAGLSMDNGKLAGEVTFDFPEYAATSTVFTSNIRMTDVALEEISNAFNATNNTRAGLVSGTVRLGGPLHGDTIKHLNGEGHVKIHSGVINQMKLFAGLTAYLSRNIPGISSIVNQSSGSMDFTIKESVLQTDNLLIEGDIFSIGGRGTYDIANDRLDFTIRANIFKKKTIAGRITHFVTLPFTRLLLEFKVFGSLDNPEWSYVNIIEKISDAFTE